MYGVPIENPSYFRLVVDQKKKNVYCKGDERQYYFIYLNLEYNAKENKLRSVQYNIAYGNTTPYLITFSHGFLLIYERY